MSASVLPTLSVIVPTRGRPQSLIRTLMSLAGQVSDAARFEVIVVANDSRDDSAARARALAVPYPLRVMETDRAGLSLARNSGAAAAAGDILVFLDDDIEVLPGHLAARAHAHVSPDLIVVGRLMAPPLATDQSLFVERLRRLDAEFAAVLAHSAAGLGALSTTGGNMSVPRDLFGRVRGFDTSLVAYGGEDYEFGLRCAAAGATFHFEAGASVYHHSHENTNLRGYLSNARSWGRNDTQIVARHPSSLSHLALSRTTKPRTWRGRVARRLVFDMPRLGDRLASSLLLATGPLAVLHRAHLWNRAIDSLWDYWYFRGVSDQVGGHAALLKFLSSLEVRQQEGAAGAPRPDV